MSGQVFAQFDLFAAYRLVSGTPVVARSADIVQIGVEPHRRFLLHHAPPDSVDILRRMDGTISAAEILQRHRADPLVWTELLGRLVATNMLVAAADWTFPGASAEPSLQPERDSLVLRHGVVVARRIMQARQDAVVVVRGTGRLATSVALALAVAGVGHVHQQPDRAIRLADLPEFAAVARPTNPSSGGEQPTRATSAASNSGIGTATRADVLRLAANLRRAAPGVKVHAPAAHHRVGLVLLAGDGPPAPSLAAELTHGRIPHLAMNAGLSRAEVGPFVLPGRSSCLVCALHHRADLDQTRPAFEAGLRDSLVVPPALLVCSATALAVADALDHLDGVAVPVTVDGTLEWQLGQPTPRRRSWAVHPKCGCSTLRPDEAEDYRADVRPAP